MSVEDTQPENPSFSAETYFATQPPPPTLEEDVARVRDFLKQQRIASRKVVLVTVSTMFLAAAVHILISM